jgi:ribonucleoside-diphosphate reductase alpha chain
MAATQPFLSGAISKTVNLPHDCTVEDIAETYVEAWRLGLKAVAIYRDGSKGVQVLNTSADEKKKVSDPAISAAADRVLTSLAAGVDTRSAEFAADLKTLEASLTHKVSDRLEVSAKAIAAAAQAFESAITKAVAANNPSAPAPVVAPLSEIVPDLADQQRPPKAIRHRLPEERASLTHKFSLAGHEGYITVGLYPSGEPGEIFIRMAKEGSTVSGLMDSFATAVSLALQHGVPLKVLVEKFAHTRFEPSGWTGNEQIGYAKSIMDYIFRWLQLRFLSGHQLSLFAGMTGPSAAVPVEGVIGDLAAGSALASPSNVVIPSGASPSFVIPSERSESRDLAAGSATNPVHVANAMKDLYDMGDAPSCHTCGAIMVRNGSCYRCMSCGSTSGCS